MQDNDMIALGAKLRDIRNRKSELEEQLRLVKEEIKSVEAMLIEAMTTEECDGFKYDGTMFTLVTKESLGAIPDEKEALYAVMKQHGFEHLFTINTTTLAATLKELKTNNDGEFPEWLDGLVKVFDKPSIQVRKA